MIVMLKFTLSYYAQSQCANDIITKYILDNIFLCNVSEYTI